MDKVNILGVKVNKVTIDDAAKKILGYLDTDGLNTVFTPNSEIIMIGYEDESFCEILNRADLLTADGIGVVIASKILKNPISERAAGYDIACSVLEKINKSGHKLYMFGGKPGVAEIAEKKLCEKYPDLKIVGTHNGYFKEDEEEKIIQDINDSGADLLFVCLGAPMQEKWIDKNRNKLHVKCAMGIGGSLDVFAGTALRAPDIYCKHGLEWFYRLAKEPWRAKRMAALPKFAMTVLIHGKKFIK